MSHIPRNQAPGTPDICPVHTFHFNRIAAEENFKRPNGLKSVSNLV